MFYNSFKSFDILDRSDCSLHGISLDHGLTLMTLKFLPMVLLFEYLRGLGKSNTIEVTGQNLHEKERAQPNYNAENLSEKTE